jgi:tetratricopeptide (TPR) repeat protein
MPSRVQLRRHLLSAAAAALAVALIVFAAPRARAQAEDEFDEDAPDPVKLYRQAQAAYTRGAQSKSQEEFEAALGFVERAIKLNPEFTEAEYLRALALMRLGRAAEAERGLRRAMELKPDWLLPPAALGDMLARAPGREREAEEILGRALKNDPNHLPSIVLLAELHKRAGDNKGALEFMVRATNLLDTADPAIWAVRGELELAEGDRAGALKTFSRVIRMDEGHRVARLRRAEIYIEQKEFDRAVKDLQALEEPARKDQELALAVVAAYARAGDKEGGRRVLGLLPESARNSPEAARLRAALDEVACEETAESRERLEQLLLTEPENTSLLYCLCNLYRTAEPERSLTYCKRAAELQPSSVRYATGYAAALVQLRRFAEAAAVLKSVVSAAPDDYVARANYATALYELKLYKESIAEYKWMAQARPETAVIHYFIGTAHDHLGEYEDALRAYETFLARADAQTNSLEIDKVNLRLPTLRNQIKRGEGVKRKGQ